MFTLFFFVGLVVFPCAKANLDYVFFKGGVLSAPKCTAGGTIQDGGVRQRGGGGRLPERRPQQRPGRRCRRRLWAEARLFFEKLPPGDCQGEPLFPWLPFRVIFILFLYVSICSFRIYSLIVVYL